MERKKVVITGANSGIGYASAMQLAAKGYDIITICRKKEEGSRVVASLKAINPAIQAENFTADLSDLPGLHAVGLAIAEQHPIIDRLINNAGYFPPTIEYKQNIEKSFLASHLGHMLLTQLLRPSLERSAEARVINLSSELHKGGNSERFFTNVADHKPGNAYADAKLANILFTIALAERLPKNVTTYAVHPGVVRTGFGKNVKGFFKVAITVFSPFFLNADQGAEPVVRLADADLSQLKSFNGKYFHRMSSKEFAHPQLTQQNAQWLWKKSEEILNPMLATRPITIL
jgi:retinol dehydrogenase-12